MPHPCIVRKHGQLQVCSPGAAGRRCVVKMRKALVKRLQVLGQQAYHSVAAGPHGIVKQGNITKQAELL